jgi:hypothetical protein
LHQQGLADLEPTNKPPPKVPHSRLEKGHKKAPVSRAERSFVKCALLQSYA